MSQPMNRTAHVVVIVVLLLHTGYQYVRLRQLTSNAGADAQERVPQRVSQPEFARAGRWLHEFYQADEGLQRTGGLCESSATGPDVEGLSVWLFDVYVSARRSGASEEEAQRAVVARIRETDEWRRKHPDTAPK